MWDLKNETKVCNKHRNRLIQKKTMVTSGKRVMVTIGYRIKRHKLSHTKIITYKDMLCSTGKCSHYFVISLNGI